MTTFLILLFISVFIISAVTAGKNKTRNRPYKKYDHREYEINTEKTKKELFVENRRKRAREHHINIEKKGKEYELHVAEYFRKQGYKIKEYGLINGKKDHGVDVIAMKDKEITLIQCKNWKENSKYKIDHNILKAFIGNTTEFLEKNKDKADGYSIKRLFVTSNDILDESARNFIKSSNLLEHKIIPIKA